MNKTLPHRATDGGYIYVIEFSNRVVKVGSTCTPAARFRQHESDAGAFGHRMIAHWLSDEHDRYLISEKTLILYAATRAGRRLRREYFQFIDAQDLKRTAREIARSNGELGVVIPVRAEQLLPLRQVGAMHPQLDLREVHQRCIYGEIPSTVQKRQFHLTRATVDELVCAHAAANPPRSVRHRLERRAA